MITLMMTSLMLTMSSAMLLSMNPLSLGIVILLTALMLTFIYSMMLTSWVAFLIFLIYVGGMLVMFAYFVALTPNQQTNTKMTLPLMLVLTSSMLLINNLNIKPPISYQQINHMNTFFLSNNIQLLLLLALILLFTMVVVVKLVTNNKGPLRPFMNYV